MRVVFMGTPQYSCQVLEGLVASGHVVVGVYTQPDRPTGRSLAEKQPPVKRFALAKRLSVYQTASLRTAESHDILRWLAPDIIVVAAYGKILPPPVLSLPLHGCLNIHASLLPRHRGPSPVVTAILDGESTTGVSIMQLDQGMDTGPLVAQLETEIGSDETATALTERLFRLGGDLLLEILNPWCEGRIKAEDQDASRATVTRKIAKSDGEVQWASSAQVLARHIRAFEPWPGLFTYWKGKLLKITEATALDGPAHGDPGLVQALSASDSRVAVVCGGDLLELKRIQLEGKRPLAAEEFVRGQRDFVGSRLPS